jgi:hypothetical protein
MAAEWNQATFQYDPVGQSHTPSWIMDKIENFLILSGWERPSWDGGMFGAGTVGTPSEGALGDGRHFIRSDRATQDRWRYTGDLLTQHCGIFVWYNVDAGVDQGNGYEPNLGGPSDAEEDGPQIVIQTFLENTTPDGVQIYTPDHDSVVSGIHRFGSIRLNIDNLAVNNYLIYGGEDGLYLEVGRDAFNANLGHGAVMVFGEIPEFNATRDAARQWTAQGLVCDMRGNCRFTVSRNDRLVTNDGTDKNFTASLQPFAARGTSSIDSLAGGANVYDNRPYYIGSRDNWLSATPYGATTQAAEFFSQSGSSLSSRYAASFGLLNTPKNDRIRISPLFMVQEIRHINSGVNSVSASNNVAATTNALPQIDVRTMRQVFRFVGADHTLIPFLSVVDSVSGATYRVGRMDDNGRFSQFGIEVPTSTIVLP